MPTLWDQYGIEMPSDYDRKRYLRDNVREMCESTSSGYGYHEWLAIVPTYTFEVWAEPIVYSNLEYARDALAAFDCEVWETGRTLYVPLYRDHDKTKGYSVAAMIGLSLLDRLNGHPLLDEDRYSEIEWEMLERFASDDLDEMRELFPGICDACLTHAHIEASRYYGEFYVDLDGSVFHDHLKDVWSAGYSYPDIVKGRCVECAE